MMVHVLFSQMCGFLLYCSVPDTLAVYSWQEQMGSLVSRGKQGVQGMYSSSSLPTLKWSFTPTCVDCEVAVGDVNNDGIPEVVTVGYSTGYMFALRGTDGSTVWSIPIGSSVSVSPVIADINNDGNAEILASTGGNLTALRGSDGSVIWGSSIPIDFGAPSAHDINGDGMVEVVAVSNSGYVYALRGTDGSILWSRSIGSGDNNSSKPAIADVNGDGQPEVVVMSGTGTVYVLRGTDGSVLWSRSVGSYSAYWFSSSPTVYDVNSDGQPEVVIGGGSGLYVLRGSDGTVVWSRSGTYWLNHAAVDDINGDGIPEIVAVVSTSWTSSGSMEVLRGTDGALLWSRSGSGLGFQATTPKVADLFPSSPGKEIAWTNEYTSGIWIFSSSGTVLWSLSLGAHSVVIADVDGDRCVEIVLSLFMYDADQILVYDDPTDASDCTPFGNDDDLDVRENAKGVKVVNAKDGFIVEGKALISVYTYDGRKILQSLVRGSKRFKLPRGVYLIKVGDRIYKTIVR